MTNFVRSMLSALTVFGLIGSSTPTLAADALTGASAPLITLEGVTAPVLAFDPAVWTSEQDVAAPAEPAAAHTLAALVDAQETADTIDAEQECLAVSVYFEAKGEPLAGQLAVAETVLNRARSGRFPESVCGVVRQPGQFSFVRGGRMPEPARASQAWRQAVAVARIAQAELWREQAPAALYFHASHVRPGFGGKRIARLGNHIFYR